VVAPLRTVDGSLAVEHPSGPLAVFPAIDGGWVAQHGRSDEDTRAEGRLMGAVHACPPERVFAAAPDLVESFEITYTETLVELLEAGIESGEDDPAFPIRSLLRRSRDEIFAALHRLEALAKDAHRSRDGWVTTHGDPTQGNNLKTPDGRLHLVDWDGIVLGPPERDIVFWGGKSFDIFLEGYRASRLVPELQANLIAFYLYHWDLQEIADWLWRLVHLDLDDEEKSIAWRELSQYVPIRSEWIARRSEEMAQRVTAL